MERNNTKKQLNKIEIITGFLFDKVSRCGILFGQANKMFHTQKTVVKWNSAAVNMLLNFTVCHLLSEAIIVNNLRKMNYRQYMTNRERLPRRVNW